MKKLFYILTVAAAAAITLVSCQEKEVLPREASPAEVANCYGVYFPTQAASGNHVFSPVEDPVLEITVARNNDKGDITVPVTATYSEEDIFVPEEIKFADGQKETTIKVRFDNAKEGVNYKASLVIDDNQFASIYNSSPIAIDFSVMRVAMQDFLNPKTNEPAVFTFTHNWSASRGEGHATMQYYEVAGVRTCIFTSIDKDEAGNPLGLWHGDPSANLTLRWYTEDQASVYKPGQKCSHKNSEGNDFVELVTQYIGFDYNGGNWLATPNPTDPINAYDWFWYWNARGYSVDELYGSWLDDANIEGDPDEGYPLGYYDGNGGFFFQIYYFIPSLSGGWKPSSYSNYLIADGFTRVDYSFEVETDYSAEGKTPVYMEAGMDVASVKYAVYEGELTATQVGYKIDGIVAGTETTTEFTEFTVDEDEAIKYATLELAPETTGYYTVVLVAYDKDKKAQNDASVVIKHIAAGDVEDHLVEVGVFTEDTPARYTSYHKYDSFAYGIAGKDLTDVHVGIFKEAVINQYGASVVYNTVKGDDSYAASEADLAAINGEGGFYDVLSGLDAKTTYYIIVWATNGDMESFAVASYTTEKLPYVWNSLGTGTLTDGFLMSDWEKDDVTVACELYEEAKTPGLFMVTGFQLELASLFYGVDPSVIIPYEGEDGNWFNSEIVIDATNPNKVSIEAQPYGIYTNGTYQYAQIQAENGTYADGKITFPAKNMYIGYTGNGKWYYANPNATFCITFPAAAEVTALTPAATGTVKCEVEHANSMVWEKPVVTFERDPQPVSVAAEVSYTRKVRTPGIVKCEKNVDVR